MTRNQFNRLGYGYVRARYQYMGRNLKQVVCRCENAPADHVLLTDRTVSARYVHYKSVDLM